MQSVDPVRRHARVLVASMVGTAIEYYDFFIYGTAAALFFGKLFFPSQEPGMATLLSFMTLAVAFIARPFGAVLFGHFGDRVGRKSTLVASILLMGGSTLLIALLPTHAAIGWGAPALLCLLRIGQGLGLGGEWAGASLLAVENAPAGWDGRFGSAPQLGVPIGFVMANGLFLLLGLTLSEEQLLDWGWRVPFLFSAVLVAIGLWIRLKLTETQEFARAMADDPPEAVPLRVLLRDHRRAVLAASAGAVACYAVFYIATSFALAELTARMGYPRETVLGVQMVAAVLLVIGNLLAGRHADRAGPANSLMLGVAGVFIAGLVFGPALGAGSLVLAGATLCATLFVMGFTNAPLAGWMRRLFPVKVRYSGVALSHNVGGVIGGGLMPLAAQALSTGGGGGYVGLILCIAALISLAGVRLSLSIAPSRV